MAKTTSTKSVRSPAHDVVGAQAGGCGFDAETLGGVRVAPPSHDQTSARPKPPGGPLNKRWGQQFVAVAAPKFGGSWAGDEEFVAPRRAQ